MLLFNNETRLIYNLFWLVMFLFSFSSGKITSLDVFLSWEEIVERGEVRIIILSSNCLWCSSWTVPLLTKEFRKVTVFKGLCLTEYWVVGLKYSSLVQMVQKSSLKHFKTYFKNRVSLWAVGGFFSPIYLWDFLCARKRTVFDVFISSSSGGEITKKLAKLIEEYLQQV